MTEKYVCDGGDREGRKRMRRPPQKRGHFYGAVIRDALLANGV